MRQVTFNTPVLKIEGLSVKFDVIPVSNSLAVLLGDKNKASIVQQLHYWGLKGYGEVIDGVRWIYKSIKEWISEVFPTLTPWQMGKLMSQLVELRVVRREKLFTKHHEIKHDDPYWHPKNQTYYYSLNTERLQELADNYQLSQEEALSLENPVFEKTQILSKQEILDTKYSDCAKNTTNTTSIENITNKPHSQAGGKISQNNKLEIQEENQEERTYQASELGSDGLSSLIGTYEVNKTLEEETDLGQQILKEEEVFRDVDEKINIKSKDTNCQDTDTSEPDERELNTTATQPQKTPKGTKSRRKEVFALWSSPEQRERFRKDVTAAIASGVGRARNITALVAHVMNEVRQGHSHTYWEEWIAEKPIGSSEKQEWEASTGKPYPKFVEYLLEKLIYPQESREQALFRVGKILSDRERAELYWRDFKRNIEALRQQSEQMEREGKTPTVPTWFVDRVDVSVERASESAQKVTQLTPNQRDWIEEKLPESEKLISGMNCPLLPPAEEVTVEDTAEEGPSPGVSPGIYAPRDEDLEFCFDDFITLDYLEHQARKIAANSGLIGILLPDFRAAFSQANSAQRERIRSVISSIYPDLLNLI
ncbi:hypothetical protein Sta7437_4803 (plasmid) [Stanieria cyanosphaera PCC 7437]|uniref:Uncharacterized protein n=1 Tax=Stanieria cyanosphaera (strain ATCC 29371 / PCC 7437) TaxID=111780 RepID=K9Y1G2_STAC7|nr:hypothetical protein [Stanieria cyanosphaera]AFZ38241.1 hypothetical protein Sta7437_4803 [Stanieria cyanosphaera PCC 7437]